MMHKINPKAFNTLFPIRSVLVFPNCVIVERVARLDTTNSETHLRGEIESFSHSSFGRLLELVNCTSAIFLSSITLTYGKHYPMDGRISKAHLNSFLTYLRLKFGKHEYAWVAEFQNRGAIHFHLLTSLAPPSEICKAEAGLKWIAITQPSKETRWSTRKKHLTSDWEEAIKFNLDRRFWEKIRKQEGAKRYITKYILKSRQKQIPANYVNCGRFWGTSRNLPMITPKRVSTDNAEMSEMLRLTGHRLADCKVIPRVITGYIDGWEFDNIDL